ncbi:MAG: preprotein translocase subunit SecY [Chitinophagales bacterium]|nr:preprotein translocase subunit SecY [Chitinophagales bacterium]MCO5280911.1 preprotein translocase subunit SecY [Chitinophagales bacterium]OJV27542.1 MAG: preprotein translocase subunit SecY [Bacteroidetes bacterium 37-13]HRN93300.1 preprotein translocase subunit SecY [Chitinophagales bacterium]HRP39637.1 preprotein translocase subunit SecY [Chitinophagales bacterium]
MKKLFETLSNIWKIEELRQRILLTFGFILIYRVGTFITLPGIDPNALAALQSQGSGGILGLVNLFAGGAFSRASVFALGIMPYISASIAIQLLTIAVPYFQKLQKEGESGRRLINQYTRWLTVAVTTFQGAGYVVYLTSIDGAAVLISPTLFAISTVIVLTTGTLFVMWMGEKITDKGLGNGISLLIMVGILAHFPSSLIQEASSRLQSGGLIVFVLELAFLLVVIAGCIVLVQGTRRIPVQYAKRNIVQGGRMMQAGGVRQYLPLKINAAGVMPIIFAQALMFLPATIAQFLPGMDQNNSFLIAFNDIRSIPYNTTYFLLVVVFTYFYTALIINPTQMADEMKRNNGFIPGVKPGKATANFIDTVISRITLPGAIFLGFVSIMPAIVMLINVQQSFALFYGGTSLIIMVGVILDTLQNIETHLLNRHYDGLTSSGRIKGRQGYAMASM